MATISKLTVLIVFLLAVAPFNHARPMHDDTVSSPLINRLKLDGEAPGCWESLYQIQACTGELILFFMNGETYIGDGCCYAIRSIKHKCWPAMLGTIGFTTEEGDILDGYCDHEAQENGDHASPPSPAMLEPNSDARAVEVVKSSIP